MSHLIYPIRGKHGYFSHQPKVTYNTVTCSAYYLNNMDFRKSKCIILILFQNPKIAEILAVV